MIRQFLARRRKLAQRKIDSERAKRGHATRIHQQFLRDPLIRAKEASNPQSPLASSTQ